MQFFSGQSQEKSFTTAVHYGHGFTDEKPGKLEEATIEMGWNINNSLITCQQPVGVPDDI